MSVVEDYINKVFPHNGVFEIILGTSGISENLSPIGIIRDGNNYFSKIFRNTLTYYNLKARNSCIINVTHDPMIFYKLLFDENSPDLGKKIYDGIPYLENAISILSNCEEAEVKEEFSIFEYRFVKIVNEGVIYKAFSRSDSLFIDLLVHVTRLDIYSKEELETYSTVIQYEVKTIARLSPNLLEILRDLVALINAKGLKISL